MGLTSDLRLASSLKSSMFDSLKSRTEEGNKATLSLMYWPLLPKHSVWVRGRVEKRSGSQRIKRGQVGKVLVALLVILILVFKSQTVYIFQ